MLVPESCLARRRQRELLLTWYHTQPLIVISAYGITRDSNQPPSLPCLREGGVMRGWGWGWGWRRRRRFGEAGARGEGARTSDRLRVPRATYPDEWLAQTFELSVSFLIQFWIVEPPHAVWMRPIGGAAAPSASVRLSPK